MTVFPHIVHYLPSVWGFPVGGVGCMVWWLWSVPCLTLSCCHHHYRVVLILRSDNFLSQLATKILCSRTGCLCPLGHSCLHAWKRVRSLWITNSILGRGLKLVGIHLTHIKTKVSFYVDPLGHRYGIKRQSVWDPTCYGKGFYYRNSGLGRMFLGM